MMKRILLSIIFIFSLIISVSAQQLELYWNDEKLPDTVGVYGDANGDFELVFEAYLKNGTDKDLRIGAAREVLQEVEGTDNSFCWSGSCYSPMTDTSDADHDLFLPRGTMSPDPPFSGHYTHQSKFGETIVKYTLFERGNLDNSVSVVVIYKYSLTGIADNSINGITFSNAYPNPATNTVNFDYKLSSNSNATISIVNLLGSVVKRSDLNPASNKISIDVSDLPQGVYFYSIDIDGKVYKTQKLIVK